ncbi:MAG: N-acetylmuramoyl-L-alanine amidase [Acetivibrionales bacterium]|jgi:N-acetylmuramoyl-L-alanine amidase
MKRFVLLTIVFVIIAVTGLPVFATAGSSMPVQVNVDIVVNGNVINPERQPVSVEGRILSAARDTFEDLGVRVDWYPDSQKIIISKDNYYIGMEVGSNVVNINGIYATTDIAPLLVRGTVMLPVRFVAETLNLGVKWDARNKAVLLGESGIINNRDGSAGRSWDRTPIVVIDAGHGGKLPGAVYSGVKEADLNLDIAKRLNNLLKEDGVKTYMTREGDYHVDLYARSGLANSVNADLFISIHNNAGNSKTSGSMTLYYPGKGAFTGRDFAMIVQRELSNTLGTKDLGIYSRPKLVVLRTTRMPAVIAEVAYMTNSNDMSKLKTEDFRQKAAEALKDGVIKALEEK